MTYHDLTANLYPSTASFNNTTAADIELIANSSGCSLSLCQLNTTFSNHSGTPEYSNSSSTNTCGCHLLVTFNLENATLGDTIVARGWVQGTDSEDGVVVFAINRTYSIYPSEHGNYTVTTIVEGMKGAFTPLSLMLVSLIFSFLVTVLVVARIPVGAMGAGLVFCIMLGIFTYYEMFPAIYFISWQPARYLQQCWEEDTKWDHSADLL